MQSTGDTKDTEKYWGDIIPEDDRMKMEAEEREKEEMEMCLPPRSRKPVKRMMYLDFSDSQGDSGSGSDKDDSDEDRPKKRGQPRTVKNEAIKDFTDAEIRRFLKSYKKFPSALKRLDAIAMDAELQEKTFTDLKKLGELIKNSCDKAMKEYQEKAEAVPKKRGRDRGPTFKIGGVSVNAKTLYANESKLQPLDIIIPADKEERKKWVLKDARFYMPWTPEDDSNLLKGVYEHGMGNWESIKMDSTLGLGNKILPDGGQKSQAKDLQARCDYLLKVLKRMTDAKPGM
ncbi:Chromodomain-helicase-DNA-binding protein 1, partial [Araneus ventricosus]